jgi:hypothetical protein
LDTHSHENTGNQRKPRKVIINLSTIFLTFKEPTDRFQGIDSARVHRQVESIAGLLKRLKIRALEKKLIVVFITITEVGGRPYLKGNIVKEAHAFLLLRFNLTSVS